MLSGPSIRGHLQVLRLATATEHPPTHASTRHIYTRHIYTRPTPPACAPALTNTHLILTPSLTYEQAITPSRAAARRTHIVISG